MNTNLEKLLKQATKEVWGNNDYNGSPEFEGYEVDQEKFAESIVRACLSHIHNSNEKNHILDHFGIK